jgi:hypothetical protein
MPFTLGNVIFISDVNETNDFRRTLVHERMHVLQRKYTSQFNKFLEQTLHFKLVTIVGKLPFTVFSNPDGLQLRNASWIFPDGDKWYCPFLTIKRGNLLKLAIDVKYINKYTVEILGNVKNVADLLASRFPTCPTNHLYHPYEIMAELGMKYIIEGTSGNKDIDHFYHNLN